MLLALRGGGWVSIFQKKTLHKHLNGPLVTYFIAVQIHDDLLHVLAPVRAQSRIVRTFHPRLKDLPANPLEDTGFYVS